MTTDTLTAEELERRRRAVESMAKIAVDDTEGQRIYREETLRLMIRDIYLVARDGKTTEPEHD